MQAKTTKSIKAIICQTECVFMKKMENIQRFDKNHLINLTPSNKIDIFLFPELAWTGYSMQNPQEAKKMAVEYGKGDQFQYARKLALRTNAYVMFGYIQMAEQDGQTVLYDSAAIVDRKGNPLTNTRKTNLPPGDKLWAKQWHCFNSIKLTNCSGQQLNCGLPICFDLQTLSKVNIDFKYADYAKEKGCEVILFMTSWPDNDINDCKSGQKLQDYWIGRLKPLFAPSRTSNALFLGSNKVGREYFYGLKKEIQFIGSSCAISINPQKTVGYLPKTGECTLQIQYNLEV